MLCNARFYELVASFAVRLERPTGVHQHIRRPLPQLLPYVAIPIKFCWNEPRLRISAHTEFDCPWSGSTGNNEDETGVIGQQIDESATERAVTPDDQNFQWIRDAHAPLYPKAAA